MPFKNIILEIKESIALIKMNRPEALNALNTSTFNDIEAAISALRADRKLAAVVITGQGKAFVAGADIAEMKDMSENLARKFSAYGQKVLLQLENLPHPVIAAINGFALGGGCELALACDIRIASENAKLGQPEVNLGVIPGFAATQRLARLIGEARAKELILTADIIDAQTAYAIGLVNKVVPHDSLLDVAMEMAAKIASKGPRAVTYAKETIHKGLHTEFSKGCALENEAFGKLFASGEANEGMAAFLEKRHPQWK